MTSQTPTTRGTGNTSGQEDRCWAGITALILGQISMLTWFLPICAGPTSIAALVFGFLGLTSSRHGLAIAGMVLGGIGLMLTAGNAALGIFMALNQP